MPLSPQMTVARLHQWIAEARPNARLIYGEGTQLHEACSAEVKRAVMALADKGWLTPHFQRCRPPHGDGLARYLVQRTARPFVKGTKL